MVSGPGQNVAASNITASDDAAMHCSIISMDPSNSGNGDLEFRPFMSNTFPIADRSNARAARP